MDVIVEIKRALTICYMRAIKILYCKKGCFVHVLNKILICCDAKQQKQKKERKENKG